jgi:hypothetical protein
MDRSMLTGMHQQVMLKLKLFFPQHGDTFLYKKYAFKAWFILKWPQNR